ncbi:MAG: ankyrin repeat domain-containing protein [Verrucomicrobiota bacterium]
MKLTSGVFILLLAALVASAQTNQLATLLQQGLLEEQANRNLDAAIAAYQSLATQFDKDRQLAATAVFRLGECYRAQGKTNEAAVQYQRILRDFPDQSTLATLSRQNLAAIGAAAPRSATKGLDQSASGNIAANSPSVTDEEDQEILRIGKLIQTSPDLINAYGNDAITLLGKAATRGQVKVVNYLLDHGAEVDAGLAPLYQAAGAGNRAMVELLLSRGADVNRGSEYRMTALCRAVQGGYISIIELLLAHKADVNVRDSRDGRTPLFMAVENAREKCLPLLLAADAKVDVENKQGRTVLSHAVENGSLETIKTLLSAKADVNGGHKDVPLLTAIYKNNLAVAEMLLQAGANPNVKSDIHWAMQFADRNYFNGLETTPLFLAILNQQLPMVQLLLKFKADPDDSRTGGRALVFNALSCPEILKALLDAGAKVDVWDESSAGAGSFSSRLNNIINGSITIIPYLKGTPLLFAAGGESNVVAVSELLQHGANPNACDGRGNTALHFAAMCLADEKVFTGLLEHKANPNVRNIDGKSPLDLVKERLKLQISGSRFPNQNQLGVNNGEVSPAQKKQAEKLISLLRQHGALDNLPDWTRITISRPSANASATIFQKNTNDWNHFTLFEALMQAYPESGRKTFDDTLSAFPDLKNIVIVRPSGNGAESKRIPVNLLEATNGVDCSRDLPLEFGDVVEIPEREHTLAEGPAYLTDAQFVAFVDCLRSRAGEVKLVVAGSQTVSLLPYPMHSEIGEVLIYKEARAVLTSKSDLSRIQVSRRTDTGKTNVWILDCSKMVHGANAPDLWLRKGDVITVPEKP